MRKIWLVPLLLLLAACGATASPTAAPANSENFAAETPAEAADTAVTQSSESPAEVAPSSSPAAAAVVRDQDWTKGPDDPVVSIIEYGDFQ